MQNRRGIRTTREFIVVTAAMTRGAKNAVLSLPSVKLEPGIPVVRILELSPGANRRDVTLNWEVITSSKFFQIQTPGQIARLVGSEKLAFGFDENNLLRMVRVSAEL